MKRVLVLSILCLTCIFFLKDVVYAVGTPAEAEAMVKKAIAFYKANGKEKTLQEASNPTGQFVKDDLYVTIYDMKGNCLAHGFNKAMIGKNLMELKDPDGVYFIKERIKLVSEKGKGWQKFKFTNPMTKKIENKIAYVEKVDDMVFMCGAYEK